MDLIEKLITKTERPGREIKLDSYLVNNKNVTVRIGTTDNKNCPQTVYIIITFWVDIKNKSRKKYIENFDKLISKKFERELKNIKIVHLHKILTNNEYFPFETENIFTCDFPENLNYNNKRSFTTIELTLHTSNNTINNHIQLPLKNKENSELFNELIKIAKFICQTDILKNKSEFKIYKTKK